MSINGKAQNPAQVTQGHILSLLDDLPAESLTVVEQFIRFLREQARQGRSVAAISAEEEHLPYAYPTVTVSPSSLDRWLNLVAEGYEGDALADTEALYDEV